MQLTYLYDTDATHQTSHNNTLIFCPNLRANRYYDFNQNSFPAVPVGTDFEFFAEDLDTFAGSHALFLRVYTPPTTGAFSVMTSSDIVSSVDPNNSNNTLLKLPNKRLVHVRCINPGAIKLLLVST